MFIENLIVVLSALVILVALWITVAVRHFKHLKKELKGQWELIDEGLRKRYDLVPNLIETVKIFVGSEGELLGKVVANRQKVVKIETRGEERIVAEYDFTHDINELINLGRKHADSGLAVDTNFLELRKEIDDLEKNIEEKTRKYNEMVRTFNRHRKVGFLAPIAAIFGVKKENIFEVEK